MLTKEQIEACIDSCCFPDDNGVIARDQIEDAIRSAIMTHDEAFAAESTTQILQRAIDTAIHRDEVVTIRLVSDQPPRMGAYLMVPDVRAVFRQKVEAPAEAVHVTPAKAERDNYHFRPDVPSGVHAIELSDDPCEWKWSDGVSRVLLKKPVGTMVCDTFSKQSVEFMAACLGAPSQPLPGKPALDFNVPGVSSVDDHKAKMFRIPEFTPEVPLGVYVTFIDNGEYKWSDGIARTRKG
ncbi:hypothetical protein D3C87_687660 [compost metagenome]